MKNGNGNHEATSIRVLDEIAFQSSVMALQAAIEAASRGTHIPEPDGGVHDSAQRDRLPSAVGVLRKRPSRGSG